jgi:DNA mismatch repair protein MutL
MNTLSCGTKLVGVYMSQRIRILPENLTNKIAAGEVVERPASVVKELVENALDSGCNEIVVEIESGGKRLIRVSDNGCGMSREDALLSLERHATSKIRCDDDLFSLSTLGFRGEALPSIASVSRFTLATRENGRIEGTEVYAEGGRIREVKACGMADGTVISVRNLFFNTPARLKFMKSSETESGHVGDIMTRMAISRPDVRFIYSNEGKVVFRAVCGDLKERISALLGRSLAAELYPVSFDDECAVINGFAAKPDFSRTSSSHMYTYINGRFIKDKVVQHAILQAYRSILERGRYPAVVLFIDVPADSVDINVHPTKHEVRFRDQGRVHDAISAAVGKVLSETPWLQPLLIVPAVPDIGKIKSVLERKVVEVRESVEKYSPSGSLCVNHVSEVSRKEPPPVSSESPVSKKEETSLGYFSSLEIIGQYRAQYILCRDGEDLLIVDQHAAHERIAFEKLKKEFARDSVESQNLLFPETMEFSFREAAAVGENLQKIKQLGFVMEEFGGNTWVLKAVPRLLEKTDYLRVLRNIVEDLQRLGKSSSYEQVIEDILARIACHSVIRGVQSLEAREIAALFSQLDRSGFSSNCPHGRPILVKLCLSEIEKMFKRG